MTANTMTLSIHMRPGSSAVITVDETNKRITHDITHHPNPAKVIAIPDDLAAPFVNLALHRTDLQRAHAFLDEIQQQGGVQPGRR